MNTKIVKPSKENIEQAGAIIRNGGLVAFPTETVYGLGANALNDEAVSKIYIAKGRPSDNPLIVHVCKKDDIASLVKEVTPSAKKVIDAFFPGPITIILPKSEKVGNVVSGGLQTVAVRMPQNPIARALIEAAGVPIAAPSANTSGRPSPTKAEYVIEDMNGKIDAIIDGGSSEFGVESTVITLATEVPTILRPGAITKEMLESVLGKVDVARAVLEGMKNDEVAASPGMKYKHYAPNAKITIVSANKEKYENFVNSRTDAFALCFEDDYVTIPKVVFGKENDDLSQAQRLFDALRELDENGAKKVYARIPHTTGVGMAVYNRLIRAAAFSVLDLDKPFLIGITGKTGSGKSFVCEKFKKFGFNVIDCDEYARKVIEPGSPLLSKIQKEFGSDVAKDGIIDRGLLAQRAFSNKENTKKLNNIMHPAIIELCIKDATFPCVVDAPQLFESGLDKYCSKTVCVISNIETRKDRIIKRDNIDINSFEQRDSIQYTDDFFIENTDFTIYNNDDDLDEQINKLIYEIL